jgi:hypothetical protein
MPAANDITLFAVATGCNQEWDSMSRQPRFSLTPHFSGVSGEGRCWRNRFNGFRSPNVRSTVRAESVAEAGGYHNGGKPLKRFRRRPGIDTSLK